MAGSAPHSRPADEVIATLETDRSGLSAAEADRRRAEYGDNEFTRAAGRSPLGILLAQFDSVLIWVLVAAALLSVWAGNTVDAVLIGLIVLANGGFGFVQEYRAERSLAALRELTAPTATVRRDGEGSEIDASRLVPGDVVELADGDVVPADGRLLSATGLEADEASLTGESLPVTKATEAVDRETPLAERASMVYKGTSVTRGSGVAVISATGDETEMGTIAGELASTAEVETPLQGELDRLGRRLGLGVVALAALVIPLLVVRGTPLVETGLTAISLAVAAVPEGLPAVVTLTLALGVRRMADENALVRSLPAVEALGSVDVICTDKTGTLTRGEMTVSRLWVAGSVVGFDGVSDEATVSNDGTKLSNDGPIVSNSEAVTSHDEARMSNADTAVSNDDAAMSNGETAVYNGDATVSNEDGVLSNGSPPAGVVRLLRAAALCTNATADSGDPTEQALVRAAEEYGFDTDALRAAHPRTDEIPFSSARKWMGTVHDDRVYVKGAPGVVVSMCSRLATADGSTELIDDEADRIRQQTTAFAADALRVLAVATAAEPARLDADDPAASDLIFLGLVGMLDPPREEVADAIAATREAGIAVKMITGDNVRTAAAIAGALGMGQEVIAGREIESMDDKALRQRVENIDVFARTTPTHKVRILRALQDSGHVVAMTGDGVNDAPALKSADIGVAMGVRGTDVAKQASDVVLLDDNYATIERAIERGRAIFDNLWKFVAYLLSANLAEVAIVFLASLWGYLILPAVQLLWINLLTDGLPALALGADPQSGEVMDRSPRPPTRGIVDREMLALMGATSTVTTIVMLGLMGLTLGGAATATPYAVTMVFTGFVFLEFEKLYVIRWLRETPTLSNRWLAGAVGLSLLLQVAVLYTPLNRFFGTVPLGVADWAVLGGVLAICLPSYLAVAAGIKRLGCRLSRGETD